NNGTTMPCNVPINVLPFVTILRHQSRKVLAHSDPLSLHDALPILPPWPGNIVPLSFTPRRRLTMLSNKSPNTDTKIVSKATSISEKRGTLAGIHNAATTSTTSTANTTPPSSPSTVLPGLTLGASLRLPHVRPAK